MNSKVTLEFPINELMPSDLVDLLVEPGYTCVGYKSSVIHILRWFCTEDMDMDEIAKQAVYTHKGNWDEDWNKLMNLCRKFFADVDNERKQG